MKTIQELEEIRKKTYEDVIKRKNRVTTKIVVGMAECGIEAGARPVLVAAMDEAQKLNLKDITIAQMGCIGLCRLEPIVEVIKPGEEKVTYVKVNPEKMKRIIDEHIVNGNIVDEYTIHESI